MKYISIGQGCLPAFYLRKFGLHDVETQFFDWIVASQKTVTEVFSIGSETDLKQAIETDTEFEDELFEGHKAFRCTRFDLLRSVHDLPPNGDRPDLFRHFFVDKYTRRYTRLMELLQSVTEPVVFVMIIKAYHSHEETERLMTILETRFPSLRYHMYVFVEEEDTTTGGTESDHLTIVRIKEFELINKPSVIQWYLNQYDWARMFQNMISILNVKYTHTHAGVSKTI
jgi:hypothetical protein